MPSLYQQSATATRFGLPLLAFLSACAVLLPRVAPAGLQPLQRGTLARLNGQYAAVTIDSNLVAVETGLLPDAPPKPEARFGPKRILLRVLDNHTLQIRLVDDFGLLAERTSNVRLRRGYCRLKTYRRFTSEFIVLNSFYASAARLSLLQNGNLTMDEASGGFLVALILPVLFPESFNRSSHLEFRRISD